MFIYECSEASLHKKRVQRRAQSLLLFWENCVFTQFQCVYLCILRGELASHETEVFLKLLMPFFFSSKVAENFYIPESIDQMHRGSHPVTTKKKVRLFGFQ